MKKYLAYFSNNWQISFKLPLMGVDCAYLRL